MRRRLLLCLLLAAGCGRDVTEPETMTQPEAVQAAMFAALFEIEGWDEGAYCVSIGPWETRSDPTAVVLQALQRAGRPDVLGDSGCTVNMEGTFRKDTEERGQSFHIEGIEYAATAAVATGFYRNHPLGAGGYECRLEKRGGRWEATECTETWIA